MEKFILISIISYLLGVSSVILFSIMGISSKCSRNEEKKKDWLNYGQDAYNELGRLGNERNKKKCSKRK